MSGPTAALINSLEYYMDDLVDCFEDFVKKSLLVISVALGTIILMIMYVLKVLSERALHQPATAPGFGPNTSTTAPMNTAVTWNTATGNTAPGNKAPWNTPSRNAEEGGPHCCVSDTTIASETESRNSNNDTNRYKNAEPITSNYLLNEKTSFSAQVASRPSFDEKILREIGLSSCSKPCNTSDTAQSESDTRSTNSNDDNPDTQTCIANHHLSNTRPCLKYIGIKTSCCSMCCVEDDRR